MNIMKGIAGYIGIPVLVVAGAATGLHYYYTHNVRSYDFFSGKTFSKVDFPLSDTRISIKDNSTMIFRSKFFGGSVHYSDNDGDGTVDQIYEYDSHLARGGGSRAFDRSTDFDRHPEKFKKADIDFRRQIRRFKPLMSKK